MSTDNNDCVFPAKWEKVLKDFPEFKDEAESADVDGLKRILFACEGKGR